MNIKIIIDKKLILKLIYKLADIYSYKYLFK